VGERVDNLIHASANTADAEREIKIWFKPTDIPPFMRDYPTVVCDTHFYYRNSALATTYEPGSIGFLAPGDLVWKTDIEALRAHLAGRETSCSVNAVAAKYLINMENVF